MGSVDSFHAPTWGSSAVLLRCRAVILSCRARCRVRGYQQGCINNGRSPQNCMERGWASARPSDAILRDDELICVSARPSDAILRDDELNMFCSSNAILRDDVYINRLVTPQT